MVTSAKKKKASSKKNASVLWNAFAVSENILGVFLELAYEDGLPASSVVKGSIDEAYDLVGETRPSIIFVEEYGIIKLSALKRLSDKCKALDISIIGVNAENRRFTFHANDVDDTRLTFQQLVEFNIEEYLCYPFTSKDVQDCIRSLLAKKESSKRGSNIENRVETQVVAIVGTKGGIGASTLCANYGYHLSTQTPGRALIFDFDWLYSNIWLNFGIDVVKGFKYLLKDPTRLDAQLVEGSMKQMNERLFLISDLTDFDNKKTDDMPVKSIPTLFKCMDSQLEYILIDCPVHQIHYLSSVLKFATKVIIVTDLTHASLSMVSRLSKMLTRFVHIKDVQLAINYIQPKSSYMLEEETFIECYDFSSHFVLPFCKGVINEAISEGVIFGEYLPNHGYNKTIINMIKKDYVKEEVGKGFLSSFWSKLLGARK